MVKRKQKGKTMQIIIDEQVNKAKAKKILAELEARGVKVDGARRDLETRSPLYNIFYAAGMTEPSVTYARG
jgi:hypothetical protein